MIINIDLVYPVGSIYFSMNSTNPSKYFGGTWTQISQGRCLVGVDTTQTEFNTVNKTGGSKYLQQHQHARTSEYRRQADYTYGLPNAIHYSGDAYPQSGTVNSGNVSNVTTGDSGNLQPYLTCYIWQRTA